MNAFLRYTLAAIVGFFLFRQVRKPSRWIGRPFAWIMNRSHSALTDWGLTHVAIEKTFTILDVGCGGGRTIEKLAARAASGRVDGVDYAEGSVAASRGHNAELIRAGRVDVRRASVSKLPFPDGAFDLVTAIETQYYWPDLPNDMREILRVLKPRGTLLVVAESYRGGKHDWLQGPVLRLLGSTPLTPNDNRELFFCAGYVDVLVAEKQDKGWICVTGRKPA
jgi:SAM-dependent methyltransferase